MPADGQNFHVPEELSDVTLSAALRAWLDGESWRSVKKMVAARRVMINGNLCVDDARRLKAGEVVKVFGARGRRAADGA